MLGGDQFVAAARGRICFAAPRVDEADSGSHADPRDSLLADALHGGVGVPLIVGICDQADFRALLGVGDAGRRAVAVHSSEGCDRALLSLLCFELLAERTPVKVWSHPVGFIPGRRAFAGLEPGGETGGRAKRMAVSFEGRWRSSHGRRRVLAGEAGQGLPALVGVVLLVVALALALVAIGGATTAKARFQRVADLVAMSAARSMHDDFPRLFVPSRLPDGSPNPLHLSKDEYVSRARAAASLAAERNGSGDVMPRLRFADGASFAPTRVRVRLNGRIFSEGRETGAETSVVAAAEIAVLPSVGGGNDSAPSVASGGGYSGPLEYRQGKPMRPDVAIGFDRLSATAAAAGFAVVVNSGFRSDAEQQELWNANPDPRWVARPGTSLHRCGTELDLGPPSAYGWLAANAPRFGFTMRYSWEPWHFGFDRGPEPCSAAGDQPASPAKSDGRGDENQGLPAFVPAAYRAPLIAAASRHDVSASLLAAQLMAESNFNPNAVSSAGAQGIAQFMPGTAASYGLDDPFDPDASIDAQARMMSELLRDFRSIELALAAYNAGPGAVAACHCVPPYPETQAYVAKILGLLDGAGELLADTPAFEVRLVD